MAPNNGSSKHRSVEGWNLGIWESGNFSTINLGTELTLLLDETGLIESHRIQIHFPGGDPDASSVPAGHLDQSPGPPQKALGTQVQLYANQQML